jgi:deoxycytidine triphosphate deaminase
MLRTNRIEELKLVDQAVSSNYRAASYDPSIGKIITPDGEEVDSYKLPPMGIVEVISRERLRVPSNMCCLAHVKTSLCNEGLLTLNTGIVDPNWNGRVSSFILNFGKDDRLLLSGDVFLRITFHELSSSTLADFGSIPEQTSSDESYIGERRRNMVERFSPEFLNLQKIIQGSVAATFDKYRQLLIFYLPTGAILLAALTFFLNFATLNLVQKWVQPNDAAKAELLRRSLERQVEAESQKRDATDARLDALEQTIKKLATPNNAK